MTKRLPIFGTHATSLCSECRGACCQQTPGAYAPEDFLNDDGKLDVEALFNLLQSGDAVFGLYDSVDANERRYYPQPAFKKKTDRLVDNRLSFDLGGCTNLTESGCKLSFEDRPFGCRTLIPIEDKEGKPDCRQPFDGMSDKQYVAIKWREYYDDLMMIAERLEPGGYWGN